MRKLVYTLMLLLPLTVLGQIITEDAIRIDDFGIKKLKKAPKTVYFKDFSIGYQYIVKASSSAYDRSLKSEITMTAGLQSELTDKDIQDITDKAYLKVEKKLKDAGYEILSYDDAKNIKEYQNGGTLVIGGKATDSKGYIYTSPTNKKFFIPTAKIGLGMINGGSGVLDKSLVRISDQLGNIIVLNFGMQINFADIFEDKQGGGSSILKGNIGLGANPYASGIVWKGDGKLGNAGSSVFLSSKNYKPFPIPGVVKEEKIRKFNAVEWKNNWTTGMKTAQSSKTTITNPVNADRQQYIAKVTQAVDEYLSIMINQLIDNSK